MSIVIRRQNGDVIWFDAITSYEINLQSSVTKQPIGSGGFVSDHVTVENTVLNIAAVLSDADFNLGRPVSSESPLVSGAFVPGTVDFRVDSYEASIKQFQNNTPTTKPVVIKEGTGVNKLLPEIVAQFTKDTIPEVIVTQQDKVRTALDVKMALMTMRNVKEEFQVLDIQNDRAAMAWGPCVFTNLTFREDENTGDGVFPVMTIEELQYTNVVQIQVTVKTQNKGRKQGTSTNKQDPDKSTGNGGKAETQPTTYSDQSALSVAKERKAEGG